MTDIFWLLYGIAMLLMSDNKHVGSRAAGLGFYWSGMIVVAATGFYHVLRGVQ